MATESQGPAAREVGGGRPTLTLIVVLLGMLTLPMAMSGTTVALPRIGADLDASGAALQWVVVGYFLAASSFMLVAGSLGDLYGRRRILTAGAAIYTAGTLASALAQHILLLDAARLLSGVGAAGVMASGGSLLAATFTGRARTRVFASLGTTAGLGLAFGPTFSGWTVDTLGWRATFLTYVAVGAVIVAGTRLMDESRADVRPRVDKAGAAAFIAGLALALFAVTQGSKSGWGSAQTLVPAALAAALFTTFLRIERRLVRAGSGRRPILDVRLARNPAFLGWAVGSFGLGAGTTGVLAFLPTYLQGANGTSARAAGLTLLLMTVPVLALPPLGARLVNRGVPARHLLVLSLLLIAAGNAWLTTLHPGISTAALAGPLLTIGAGQGLSIGIIDAQAMSMVAPSEVGMASGFLNTVRGGTGAVMLTVFGALLLASLESRLGSGALADRVTAGAGGHAPEFTAAWQLTLWAVTGLMTVLALVVHRLLSPAAGRRSARPGDRARPTARRTRTSPYTKTKTT
ncbi:MFS transporter [Streptomyces longispororuber]|uniref:MFS transporter n=1 Tax=Streptomyces longispororuber TaxID=68230 RepID=UPI00210BC2AB|nr:MFS transporter [Streptomyces longispororuber]MCQ4214159.1 MFS transporter [Streptomyces longispororuber]